jgi:heme/copper-type cytochrome/quinol oxidase subunit 2
MVSYLTLAAMVASAVAAVMLFLSLMLTRKATPSDDDRKKATTYQTISIVLVLISLALSAIVAFYPSLGQRYQAGSLGAAPRATV